MKLLPEKLRLTLSKPLGPVLSEQEVVSLVSRRKGIVISVGDTCSYMLLKDGTHPDIIIYDLKNQRLPVSIEVKKTLEKHCIKPLKVKNPAGAITDELVEGVKKVLCKGKGSIFVEGEEDLTSLLILMFAPTGAILLYGQPKEGVVTIKVDEKISEIAKRLYAQFE